MDQVYNFWFGENANTYSENYKMNTKLWFSGTTEIDSKIILMFKDLMENTAQNPTPNNAKEALCMIILLDQFPRHVYRGTANAFKFDNIALQIAENIVKENWINNLSPIEAVFVYFAFMHQESAECVQKSVFGFENLSKYAVTHQSKVILNFKKSASSHLEIIKQFGRYPHRNLALGRTSTPEELEFLDKYGDSLFMKSQQPKEKVELSISENNQLSDKALNRIERKKKAQEKFTSKPEAETKKKLKILCLHGWRQNGQVFRAKIKKMIKEFADIAEFNCVTSPVEYKPEGDVLEATLNAYETVPLYTKQRAWWISSEGNKIYQYNDISLAFLKQVWEKDGPFDGIFGFAQGGTMAAIMSCKEFNPQFLILISSYFPRADEFKFMDMENSLSTPSIHIYGRNDILVIPERSKKLHQIFKSGKLIEHEGGHFTPKYWPYNEIKLFISQFTPYANTTNAKIVEEFDWNQLILSTNEENVIEIANKIATQLKKDFAIGYNIQQVNCTDKFHFDKPNTPTKEMCPSKCVDAIPSRSHSINKKYKLYKFIASQLFPTIDEFKQDLYFHKAVKILRKMRYHISPEYNDKIINHYLDARSSMKRMKMLENEPPSHHIINPKPEPVTVCPLEDLDPLIEFLEKDNPVNELIRFARGTLTAGGSLDLCKQVVGPRGIGPVLHAMHKASSVKRLLLGNNIVGDSGAEEIAEEMQVSKLECWYIAGNEFTYNGIVPITEAMKNNKYCTSLWLKRNPLGPLSMKPIGDMLMVNKTLQVLDLVNCGLLDSGLETLLESLSGLDKNTTLEVLWLDTNAITYKSAENIANYISKFCKLTDLSLSCNRLCDNGIEIIAKALPDNNILQRVSFASNRIGPSGAKYLSDAIKNHPSINFLNVGYIKSTDAVHELGNFIGDEGALYMAEMLKHNTVIRHLDLLHNSISQTGVNHIISALEKNNTLVKLQLTQFGKVHNEPGKEYIKEKLSENYSKLDDKERVIVDKIIMPWYIEDIYSVYRTKF